MSAISGGGSLRLRLMLFAAFGISLLLAVTGLTFQFLFKRHVERYAVSELNTHFEQLAAGLSLDKSGQLQSTAAMSDPRFEQPASGMYWQIESAGVPTLRSRSLWDEQLDVPTPPEATEEDHDHELVGPGGTVLLALERLVILPAGGQEKKFVVTVAMDRGRISNTISSFRQSIIYGLFILYGALLAATLSLIALGLKPLERIKTEVERLRMGKSQIVGGAFPNEIEPLVDEVNGLVAAREKQLERARQRAGNLAHGLKTPLTVLSAIADEISTTGKPDAAASIRLAAGQMRDLVDRELSRSRMAPGDASRRAALRLNVERVVDTLRRAPRGDAIDWVIDVPGETRIAIDNTDLLELLGNLIDNARKHARSRVRISYYGHELSVEDDGPGVPPDKLATIARRGVQLDALAPGSGLGLSIVSDLADVYDLKIGFAQSRWGGFKVTIGLPALP